MNTCINCDSPAEAVLTTATPANYCMKHLPSFAIKNNRFVPFEPVLDVVTPIAEPVAEPPAESPAPKSSKKATSKATAEETTAPAEEPTP